MMARQSNGGTETWQIVNGLRGRCDYENRAAQISILAGGIAPRPDTLKQTEQGWIAKLLADGAGRAFTMFGGESWAKVIRPIFGNGFTERLKAVSRVVRLAVGLG